jgi:hypothetical protein
MSDKDSISSLYVISKPAETPTGLTVLLPGTTTPGVTIVSNESYNSTRDVLISKNQLVIAFKTMNPFGKKHDEMALDVVAVVESVCALGEYAKFRKKYNIVGHSLGAKVALMVAAKYDKDNINVIIAMDPVDDKPQELTAPKGSPTTDLKGTKAKQIHLLQSGKPDMWTFLTRDKMATAIKEAYPTIFVEGSSNYTLYINPRAGHMSYLDFTQIFFNNDEDSKAARAYVHKLIRDHIGA